LNRRSNLDSWWKRVRTPQKNWHKRGLDWTVGERESGLHRRTGIKEVLTGQLAKKSQDSTEELAIKGS
jgi:hypothetical protein